mmetsp:Transcript_119337/g.382511  ORF Transcript_119337/g.382511 Transcript_119337/m.382511 type:complete len:192 (+) Transcript_119337:290-865(+)
MAEPGTSSRSRALELVKGAAKLPAAVLVDLDYTCWPFWLCHHATGPPFAQHHDGFAVVDCSGRPIEMYPEAPAVLCALHSLGVPLVACSRSDEPEWCRAVAELYVLDPSTGLRFGGALHEASVIRPARSKVEHLREIQAALGVPFQELLFFDDERRICDEGEAMGVRCVCVAGTGLNLDALAQGLQAVARL